MEYVKKKKKTQTSENGSNFIATSMRKHLKLIFFFKITFEKPVKARVKVKEKGKWSKKLKFL